MSSTSITGRVAIVTGGGRGIGRAMVLGLARAGAQVVATAAGQSGHQRQPDRSLTTRRWGATA